MPEYEYVCNKCGKIFDVFFSFEEIAAKPTVKCPECKSDQVKKQITGFFVKTSKKS
jgi:putative FmdB family regulatory protein